MYVRQPLGLDRRGEVPLVGHRWPEENPRPDQTPSHPRRFDSERWFVVLWPASAAKPPGDHLERQLSVILIFLAEALGGFLAGAAFAVSLVIGVALFVGNVLLSPELSSRELDTVLDQVAGPAGLVFACLGAGFGFYRSRLKLAVQMRGSLPVLPRSGQNSTLSGIAIAVVVSVLAGGLVWPYVLIASTNRGIDTGTIVGATAIPIGLGIVAVFVWLHLKNRRQSNTDSNLKRHLRTTHPGLVGVAVASSLLIGGGTFAAIADWHQIFLVLIGVPLTIALFVMHLFSCLFFFRPLPRPLPEGPAGRPTERIEWPQT